MVGADPREGGALHSPRTKIAGFQEDQGLCVKTRGLFLDQKSSEVSLEAGIRAGAFFAAFLLDLGIVGRAPCLLSP